jgi:hypothetical protein
VIRNLIARSIRPLALLVAVCVVGMTPLGSPALAEVRSADNATKRTLTTLICEGDIADGGCGTCPSFTGMAGESPLGGAARLSTWYIGSFAASEAIEAYVPLIGCEPHSFNYQGAVLLRKLDGTWSFVRYDPGSEVAECIPFRYRTGADLLVCEGAWMGQGYVVSYVIATYIGPQQTSQRSIVRAQSNAGTCDDVADEAQIVAVRRRDTGKRRGLEVTVTESHGKRPDAAADCPEGTNGRTVKHTLKFTFSGSTFTPAAASAATVSCLGRFVDGKGKAGVYCPTVK